MKLRLPWGAIVSVWLTLAAAGASAQVSTQESASVIVFPKVIANGVWETTIQLSNGANRRTNASCHYVNAQLTFPQLPAGPTNPPLWIESNFSITLLRQQPTHWVASRGRAVAPNNTPCNSSSTDCDTAGALIGRVPSLPEDFIGELVCVEVDASGAPWSGNGLHGFATLTHLQSGEIVKYPGIGLSGFPTNDADLRLCLGGEPNESCPSGGEYAPCPSQWTVSHPTSYDDSAVDGPINRTHLTIVPCSQDFDNQVPGRITLSLRTINEFEQNFSASTTVTCWGDFALDDVAVIFSRELNGTDWLQTKIQVASAGGGGFMLVQQTEHELILPPELTVVATTPHQQGGGEEADIITLPVEVQP